MFDKLKEKLGLDISQENFRIRAEQLNALVAARPHVIGTIMAVALLLVLLMWQRLNHTLLLSWLAALYFVHAMGIIDWLRSPRKIRNIEECRRWQRQLLRSLILVGAFWGSAGYLMFVPDSLVEQAFLLCILIGMASGVVASIQTFLLAQQSYVVLVLTPITLTLLFQGEEKYYLLAALVSLYMIFVMKAGRDQSRNLELSIRRQFENSELMENLKRANEQLALAQRAAQAGFWEWDIAKESMVWTDELYLLFGLDAHASTASFDSWRNIIHPADRERAAADVTESFRNGTPLFSEYRIVMPGGQIKCIVTLGNSTRNEHGKTVNMMGLCYDNTVQKAAQRRAHQAESRYHALIEQAGSALLVHDLEGRLLEVNRQACETLGYSREELLQMKLGDISTDLDLAEARLRWEQLEPGNPLVFTSTHRRKDGSTFPVEVRLTSILLDERKLVMSLVSDIGERLCFEAALQLSEERYRTFAEKLPLGITVLQDGLVKYVNQAMTSLLGYPAEALLEKPFMYLIHEGDRDWAVDLHRRRMRGEDVKAVFVVRMLRQDGAVRRWELNTSTTDWDGKRSALAIVSDITERVSMEEALRNSVRQLEEKELAKTRFLAAAGHDLRQPVAAANLFVDALKNTKTTKQQSELIGKLDQSMTVFSELLERLLDISRFDAGLVKPQIVSFNLIELFDWLEQNFAEDARGRGLAFRVFFPMRSPLIVRTDIGLLQSIMMNLVTNAIKYTYWGGVLVAARQRGNRVLLQVWDTGCGIAEADIDKIFDEFYQVGNPQRNREAGLGLGLSIGRRALALLGDKINCSSEVGRGSVFEFTIPLDMDHQRIEHFSEPDKVGEVADKNMFNGKRIVVLEDDGLVAEGLISLLQGAGAEVLHFPNAEEALENCDIAADYFVADYSLGMKLTGAEFLQEMQRRAGNPIKGVIVTGETSSMFMEGITGLPWPVLHKPVNFAKLAAALT
ncbi:MAG: PAS domain S-box protein [Gammaproteobacteria bacterium]|nr:PAS domain S-box protein [Gammaproteobacteria bacterium]MBU1480177.1 PAS domain S-box protein [Gammaproteobacteria bacterium]